MGRPAARAQPRQAGDRAATAAGVMLVRVLTLGFDPATARFDDEVVWDFVADKEVEMCTGKGS